MKKKKHKKDKWEETSATTSSVLKELKSAQTQQLPEELLQSEKEATLKSKATTPFLQCP